MAAALCYGSRGGGAALAFHRHPNPYDTDSLIGVLGELRGFLGGQQATLLWDGLPAHRSKAMRAWLRRQRHWLVVERLPAYAPDLNPVEALWSNLKKCRSQRRSVMQRSIRPRRERRRVISTLAWVGRRRDSGTAGGEAADAWQGPSACGGMGVGPGEDRRSERRVHGSQARWLASARRARASRGSGSTAASASVTAWATASTVPNGPRWCRWKARCGAAKTR